MTARAESGFERHLAEVNLAGARLGYLLTATLMPAGILLDAITHPEKVWLFFQFRIVAGAAGLALFWLSRFKSLARFPVLLGAGPPLICGLAIEAMILELDPSGSPYYAGLNLCILAVGVLYIWRWRDALLVSGAVVLMWALPLVGDLLQGRVVIAPLFNNLYFLLLTAVISVSSTVTRYRSAEREYNARRELEITSQRLSGTLARLVKLDALKSEFFANVSHELRTPLTLILAPIDERLLREVSVDERRLLEGLRRNAWRLLRLIDDLLDLSRLDAGQLRLELSAIDLGAMARQLGALFASAAQARGLTLVVEGVESTTDLWGDARRLDSALSNLLGNAFKFTPSGGTVWVRVGSSNTEVSVTVKDTGPGIAPADLTRIFERYYQAEEGSARRVGGVGIGLALARNLVDLHGGRLEVESELGQGAAFTITLLRGKGHIKPEVIERRRVQVEGAQGRRASDATMKSALEPAAEFQSPRPSHAPPLIFEGGRRARVLVVEDNPEVRAMLVELLSVSFEVLVAPDGSAGLLAVKKQRPDLVLSDVMMPILSGTQLCKAIKADPLLSATPVILLTARGGADAAIEGFASGADEFVEKPFHPRVLVARVQAQLRLRSLSLQVTAQARLAAVGTLAAGVGHEVRNPVNAVLNGIRALQERPGLDGLDLQLLEVIADGAQRINVISGALLTHVSPGDGGGLRPVDPRAGLDSTLRLLNHRLTGIEVHRDYSTELPVVASAAELNQILVNLVDNAIRAPAKRLWVLVKEVGEKVEISVADDGPGVPEEIASRLFDPFFTTRGPGEGTGLGLYLSKQAALRWGGDLRFAPRPGGGTSFTVELPKGTR